MPKIVVVGAGVSGLTSALLLAKDKDNVVTVVAKHMPGDTDAEYTSPWAGANYMPMSSEPDSRWERRTWPELKRLASDVPEAGIHFQKTRVLKRIPAEGSKPATPWSLFDDKPWFSTLFDDFRALAPGELPPGVAAGVEFTSVCINTALYLPWLAGQCLAHGVVLRRAVLSHISEAAALSHGGGGGGVADVVVNATGLLSCRLGGVMDDKVYPARGQIVVVRNELPTMYTTDGCVVRRDGRGVGLAGPDEMTYTMMRAGGGGTVLGGCYQARSWDPNPCPSLAGRIMARAVALAPELVRGGGIEDLDVVRHGVGFRPAREGGVRLERELVGGKTWVVHNYGHGGWGYQGSYGCAERVVELVGEVLAATKKGGREAKL